jgi:hypothetical protein
MGLKAAWKALVGGVASTPQPAPEVPEALELSGFPELVAMTNAHHAELAQLRLEWSETLDKITAWANRQAARDRVRFKASMKATEAGDDDGQFELTPAGAQPMAQSAMEGIPGGAVNGHRHPKADLYARIRGR